MGKTERARLLDTLRKRRSRKKERALNEGKPEDFYITEEDYIDFYEQEETSGGGTGTPVKAATTARRTSATRKKPAEPDEEGLPGGVLIGVGLAIVGCVIGIPLWIAWNAS